MRINFSSKCVTIFLNYAMETESNKEAEGKISSKYPLELELRIRILLMRLRITAAPSRQNDAVPTPIP
jgi:hypothetical protein